MRYKVIVSRVQTAERFVRAVTEEDAIRKIQDELDRPYGFLGQWTTVDTGMDIVEAVSPMSGGDYPPQLNQRDGSYMLSLKAAGKYLGLSYSSLYQLVIAGEIEHVMVGSRRYITRDQIADFIAANSHKGYHAR